MEASHFYYIVLPLGIFVFLLTALAYYYARKEELARRNWKKLMNAYTKKQLEQKKDVSAHDYHDMKLERALEQLNVATSGNGLSRKEENDKEPHYSEEDASYNVT
jgi:Flp pilus assembly protein TadB